MTKKEQQGKRLFSLLEALKMSQTDFSKQIGISQPYVNAMIRGTKSISYRVINAITNGLPTVNLNWLLEGEGDMLKSEKSGFLKEPEVGYIPKEDDPFGDLKQLLAYYEQRIKVLEADVERLKEHVFKK